MNVKKEGLQKNGNGILFLYHAFLVVVLCAALLTINYDIVKHLFIFDSRDLLANASMVIKPAAVDTNRLTGESEKQFLTDFNISLKDIEPLRKITE